MKKIWKSVVVAAALFMVLGAWRGIAAAQWSNDPLVNNAISTAVGNQSSPQIASDGNGGAIIAWRDRRNGIDYDIYAQRIDANGAVQWATDGAAISIAAGDQSSPQIVSDSNGGAIVVWEDWRNGVDFDIYAQRIDANGAVQWTADGVPISTVAGDQFFSQIASDGNGGAVIVWVDFRNGNADIFAQRIDANGAVQWAAGGTAISTAAGDQGSPLILSDGNGGAIVVWEDWRNGVDSDIYAQRIGANGAVQWTADGVAISTEIGGQSSPSIVSDNNGGAVMAWDDYRNGNSDIFAQRIDANGAVQWTADGTEISIAAGDQGYPKIASDGNGGAVIVWGDNRNGNGDIYAQRIDANGTVQWTVDGTEISTAVEAQQFPSIVSDGNGGAVIGWQDYRNGIDQYIYAQRIDANGTVQWATDGTAISMAAGDRGSLLMLSDNNGGAVIAWQDFRNGVDYDVYASRVNSSGALDPIPPTVDSVNPINNQTAVAINTTIAAIFSEAMNNATIITNNFTINNGAVSGTVSYDAVSKTATFTPSANLGYATTYTATITTGVKDSAGNNLAFAYTWSFTTGAAPDTTPPTISSASPSDVATDIAVNTIITAVFSETMDPLTIDANTFTLNGGVAGAVTYDAVNKTAIFTPSANLAYGTTYTATITTGVKDSAGNSLASDYTWSFTTGVAPDTTPPTISSASPSDVATDIAVNTIITAVFSETMDPSTFYAGTFTVNDNLAGWITYDAVNKTAVFTPLQSLDYNTTYTATITTGVKDNAGNSLASDYTWSFTTIAFTGDSDGDGVNNNIDEYPNDNTKATPLTVTNTGKIRIIITSGNGAYLSETRGGSRHEYDPDLDGKALRLSIYRRDGRF